MLDEISKALPDFVWLTSLDQTGAAVRFTGQSNGLTAVADFISALQRSGWFPTVDLVSSTEADEHRHLRAARPPSRTRRSPPRKRRSPPRRPPQPQPAAAAHGRRRRSGREGTEHGRQRPHQSSRSPASSASPPSSPRVICGGFYYFWYPTRSKQERQKTASSTTLQKEIRALEVTANKLPEFQREVALLEAKLETLKRILPPEKETPGPDAQGPVPGRAVEPARSGSSTRRRRCSKEFYQEWPINMDVEGTYHNLGMFFDRVSRLSRLVNIGNLKIKSQANADAHQHDRGLLRRPPPSSTWTTPPPPPQAAGARPRPGGAR